MNEILFCLLVGFTFDGIFIVEYYKNHYLNLLIFKTVSSLVFVVLGILMAVQKNTGLSWLIVCGLICGVFGDFFLDAGPVIKKIEKSAFIFGFGAFFLGHLFYIAHTMILLTQQGYAFRIILALGFALVIGSIVIKMMLKICMPTDDILKIGIAYLLSLDFSCLLACSLWMTGTGSLYFALGTTLFAVSDHMLVVDYFGFHKVNWLHGVVLILYYAAQCLIAVSILG